MTKDEITAIGVEAGLLEAGYTHGDAVMLELSHFAALVAARERERCAQLCDQWDLTPGSRLASAIRALNTEGEGNDATTAQKGESK